MTLDYPEHLNPFREEAEDNNEELNITDRRCSSSLVNARNVFSTDEGKSKDSTAACRSMQWIRKLFKKARFRRSLSSVPTKFRGPQETFSPVSLRLSHRSTNSQCPHTSSRPSPTPSSSPSALHSSNSRSMFPPNDTHNIFSSSPSRAAPPNERTSLSRNRPLLVASNIENALNDVNSVRNQTTPAPAVRKASFPTSASEKTVGEQATKDETKYIQQGTKSKKKRRAPAPPTTLQANPTVTILKSIETI